MHRPGVTPFTGGRFIPKSSGRIFPRVDREQAYLGGKFERNPVDFTPAKLRYIGIAKPRK